MAASVTGSSPHQRGVITADEPSSREAIDRGIAKRGMHAGCGAPHRLRSQVSVYLSYSGTQLCSTTPVGPCWLLNRPGSTTLWLGEPPRPPKAPPKPGGRSAPVWGEPDASKRPRLLLGKPRSCCPDHSLCRPQKKGDPVHVLADIFDIGVRLQTPRCRRAAHIRAIPPLERCTAGPLVRTQGRHTKGCKCT